MLSGVQPCRNATPLLRHAALPTKSKTTPCKVAGGAGVDACTAKIFDTSAKSAALFIIAQFVCMLPHLEPIGCRDRQSVWRGLRRRNSAWLFAASCHSHWLVRSSMRNTGTGIGEPSFLKFPGFPIVTPSFNIGGRHLVPRSICVGICGSELLFGAEAIRELVKLQIGLYRSHAANQDDQNPFHRNTHASAQMGK
jgi:hypothetical protein